MGRKPKHKKRKREIELNAHLYANIHEEWFIDTPGLNVTESCWEIANQEEYIFNPPSKRAKRNDDAELSDAESVSEAEVDRMFAEIGLLSETAVAGMKKVQRQREHKRFMARERKLEDLARARAAAYRESQRTKVVAKRRAVREKHQSYQKKRAQAIKKSLKTKHDKKFQKQARDIQIKFRGNKGFETHLFCEDDVYDDVYSDEEEWYDDDYAPVEPNRLALPVGFKAPQKDFELEEALLRSQQFQVDYELEQALSESQQDEELRKALEESRHALDDLTEEELLEIAFRESLALERKRLGQEELEEEVADRIDLLDDEVSQPQPYAFEPEFDPLFHLSQPFPAAPQESFQQRSVPIPDQKKVEAFPPLAPREPSFADRVRAGKPKGKRKKRQKGRKLELGSSMNVKQQSRPSNNPWGRKAAKPVQQQSHDEDLELHLALIASLEASTNVVDEGEVWACAICTFENKTQQHLACSMCGAPRS